MEIRDQNIAYRKKLGAYRPHFQGKPEHYYTLSCGEVMCALSVCLSIVLIVFWLCVGFYFWSQNISTSSLITTWSIVLIVFVPLFMIAAFVGSRGKAEVQQNLIKEAMQKQTVMFLRKQKSTAEANRQNLRLEQHRHLQPQSTSALH